MEEVKFKAELQVKKHSLKMYSSIAIKNVRSTLCAPNALANPVSLTLVTSTNEEVNLLNGDIDGH